MSKSTESYNNSQCRVRQIVESAIGLCLDNQTDALNIEICIGTTSISVRKLSSAEIADVEDIPIHPISQSQEASL